MEIRRILTIVEQSPNASGPTAMRVATAAAIKNPLVESYEEDLERLLDLGGNLGKLLAEEVLNYADNGQIVNVTKAALVGSDSVLEHAAALLHRKFSASVSGVLGDVPELLPSKKAQGGPGAILSIPMDSDPSGGAFEIRVQGSPQPDEIVVALAINCSGAPATDEGGGSGDSPTG